MPRAVRPAVNSTLFLDFDGVLHPDYYHVLPVDRIRPGDVRYFVFASVLDEALAGYCNVQIVLSTTWGLTHGFERARAFLPHRLRERTVGTTHELSSTYSDWRERSRYAQIVAYVERYAIDAWLALDDDTRGWPDEHAANLLATDPRTGLSDVVTIQALHSWLKAR